MVSGKIIAGRFAVDENLTCNPKNRLIVEHADRHVISASRLQSIEQVRPADLAETALRPFRRIVDADIFVSGEDDSCGGCRQKRTSRSTAAHLTMAGVMLGLDVSRGKAYRAT